MNKYFLTCYKPVIVSDNFFQLYSCFLGARFVDLLTLSCQKSSPQTCFYKSLKQQNPQLGKAKQSEIKSVFLEWDPGAIIPKLLKYNSIQKYTWEKTSLGKAEE